MSRSRIVVLILAAAVTAAGGIEPWWVHGAGPISTLRWFWLAAAGIALAYGLCRAAGAADAERRRPGLPPAAVWWTWSGCLAFGILAWPFAFEPDTYSLATWLFFGSLACLPAALADDRGVSFHRERAGNPVIRLVVVACLLYSIVATCEYLRVSYRSIGSVDFFYYICTARDMLAPGVTVSDNSYFYFPGVYAFWRTVMRLVGESLPVLQFADLLVLVFNAVLIATLIALLTRSVMLSLFSAVWYLVLLSRFEGLTGVSEPLATAVVLIGLLIWRGQSLVGHRGWFVAALFGAAMGMTVYMKQQAGLLTLGAASLIVCRPAMPSGRRHSWGALATIPLVAIVVFLVGILLEGRGWLPLTRGLTTAADYGREGSLMKNLYTQVRGDESAAVAAGLMVLAWCGMLVSRNRQRWCGSATFQLASFAVIAFLVALVPFASRPFGHYMLLAIPWLVLGTVLLGQLLWPLLPERLSRSKLFLCLALGAAAIPLVNTSGRSDTLYVWRVRLPADFTARRVWHEQPAQKADLALLRTVVAPGSRMYILPPRRNSIYFLLGTRTANPDGYWFFQRDVETMPWDRCDFVLLLTRGLNDYDHSFCPPEQIGRVRRLLRKRGFQPRLAGRLQSMELYENPSPKK